MSLRLAWPVVLLALLPIPAAADDAEVPAHVRPMLDLYQSGKLFDRAQYKAVRAAFAQAFQQKYERVIRDAYGDDHSALTSWLDKNPEIREEFYTALIDRRDNVPSALRLFRDFWKKYPDDIGKYSNLAIATAIVWDEPPQGVYDYRAHQMRTRSLLPDTVMKFTALDSFTYSLTQAREIQGRERVNRLQILPWEFLVYVVDHRTPVNERQWAIANYVPRRPMIGKIYSEVEYDKEMQRTQSKVCRLTDKPYTLESIRKHGGVCAMQADFACRVAKSIGVPAAYVRGQGVGLEQHAWVMWVEVHGLNQGKINFTLESHGRYLIDQYYTGTLRDPQTAEQILDRDMERRLGVVALDRAGKRQADLAMRAFDLLNEQKKFTARQKFAYLGACLKVSPYNEGVWRELAEQVTKGELSADARSTVMSYLDSLLKTYARYPDFTWKMAPQLAGIEPDGAARNKVYERLVHAYEAAGRPDLACQARLKWAEHPIEQKSWQTAARGLAQTIGKFPAEGRYVPAMMTKLQEVCGNYKGGTEVLGKLYLDVLGHIPVKRGSAPSKYCISMYEQAIAFFKDNGKERVAARLEAQLALVKASKARP